MEQTQPDSGDVEIAAAAAAAIDAADEGNAADPPGPEQGGEDELAEAAPAGSVEALLQQILAGQQLHQQKILALQKQEQQQQQPVPQQQQQLHAPPAGALLAQPAGGIIPHPASAPANPSKSAGGKLTEKRMAELWNSSAGLKYFLLRGGFNVGRGMDMARLQMITKNKAHITEQAAAQMSTLWACKTEHFSRLWLPAQCQRRCPRRYTSSR